MIIISAKIISQVRKINAPAKYKIAELKIPLARISKTAGAKLKIAKSKVSEFKIPEIWKFRKF